MKKIVLTLAMVCAAVGVQAATVTWGSGKMFTAADGNGGSSSTTIGASATGYLFALSASEYESLLAGYNASGDMSHVYNAYKDALDSATGKASSGSRTSAVTIKTEADVGDTVYGALIYVYHDDALGKDFYIANLGTGTVGAESGITISNLGTRFLGASANASTGWVSSADVPEPTSGLLLLLGVGALALRRRQR